MIYENAQADALERTLARQEWIDYETHSLSGMTMFQSLPRATKEYASELLAIYKNSHPYHSAFISASIGPVAPRFNRALITADYANLERRMSMTVIRDDGLKLEGWLSESTEEETACEELLPLGWEDAYFNSKRNGAQVIRPAPKDFPSQQLLTSWASELIQTFCRDFIGESADNAGSHE